MGMFDDMFSSSRGAGVMGTLLALVVLVGFGSLYMFVFDEGLQGGSKSIQQVIKEQTAQIDSLKAGINHHEKSLADSKVRAADSEEVISLERQGKIRSARQAEMLAQRDDVQAAIAQHHKAWEEYKEQYRVAERKRAEGEEIGNIVTKSGRAFEKVVIKTVEPLRISFRHVNGNGTMLFEDIPDDLVDRFQMTKEAAKKAAGVEGANAGLTEIDHAIVEAKQEIAYQQSALRESQQAFQAKEANAAAAGARIQALGNDISALNNMIAAEANKDGLRRTNQYQAQIDQKRRQIENERNKAADLAQARADYEANRTNRESTINKLQENLRNFEEQRKKLVEEMQKKAAPADKP